MSYAASDVQSVHAAGRRYQDNGMLHSPCFSFRFYLASVTKTPSASPHMNIWSKAVALYYVVLVVSVAQGFATSVGHCEEEQSISIPSH
jgi:hypothetical protein